MVIPILEYFIESKVIELCMLVYVKDRNRKCNAFDFCPFLCISMWYRYMPLTHNIGQSRPPISVSQVMPYESKEDISLL